MMSSNQIKTIIDNVRHATAYDYDLDQIKRAAEAWVTTPQDEIADSAAFDYQAVARAILNGRMPRRISK